MFKPVSPKVNFVEIEHRLLDWWYSSGLVQKYLHKNDKSEKRFSFLDGPITANNPMGVHHAWGRTYKDLWQRYKNMQGYKQRFQNGFDCQGLWVEVEVEKELGFKTKKDIEKYGVDKFVKKCKERVKKYSDIQTEQSKRLGYFMDWDHSYFTMSEENNYSIWHFLKTCWEKGWIYKGHDVVPWCPRCETAISQHEILTEDYKEITHETVFLSFPVKDKDFSLLVWTTTPWTVPANVCIAVNPNYKYVIWTTLKGQKIVTVDPSEIIDPDAKTWFEKHISVLGLDKSEKKFLKGLDLVGLFYEGAFDNLPRVKKAASESPDKFHTVVPAKDLVIASKGSGILHVSTGTGEEDHDLGLELGLPIIEAIDDAANYLDGFGDFSGQNAKFHPEIIINFLKQKEPGKFLLQTAPISHRYPACWRCKTELVWKIADEWYVSMDKLRSKIEEVTKKITWLPSFGLDRELDWLKNMHDWLISKKNRYWGLALPIYECPKCRQFEVIGSKEELKEKSVSGWEKFEGHTPHKPWIDKVKIKCPKCGEIVGRIPDVGNPWLDAGIVSFSTLSYTTDKKYWREWFPADFITESFPGQFKNWFYSLLVMSTVLANENPFKTVLGYASLLAEDGRPMHKSWGNAVEFNEGADKIGVDVMRWLYVTHDPTQNLLFGYKVADETRRKFHLMLWNIYVFFVTYANIDKWEPTNPNSENTLDKWIISLLNKLIKNVSDSLDKYDPFVASTQIQKFVEDLSTWYVRRIRDRVGPSAPKGKDKDDCHATLCHVLATLCKVLAPFNPFISEEMYQNLTGEESVHLSSWPVSNQALINSDLEEQMTLARLICERGHALRKENNIKVRQPLSEVTYSYSQQLNSEIESVIASELNVKNVRFNKNSELKTVLNLNLTSGLLEEGQARDIVREIQGLRKDLGCAVDELIEVELASWPKSFEEYIKKETLAAALKNGPKTNIIRQNAQ